VCGQAEDRAAATAAQKAAFKKTYTGPQIPALDGKEKAKYLKKLPAFEEARAACGSQAEASGEGVYVRFGEDDGGTWHRPIAVVLDCLQARAE
jgi:hypothetical protein